MILISLVSMCNWRAERIRYWRRDWHKDVE